MQATLKDVATSEVLNAVTQKHQSVFLTQRGITVAEIRPHPHSISGAEFARLWKARSKMGQATAETVARNIAEIKKAECGT